MSQSPAARWGPVLLLVCVGIFLTQGWARASARAERASEDAEFATRAAETLRLGFEAREEGFREELDSVVTAFTVTVDSLTDIPAPVPETSPELEMVLDTAVVDSIVAVAITAVRVERDSLRVQVADLGGRLLSVRVLADSVLFQQAAVYETRLLESEQVNAGLQTALTAQEDAAEAWRAANTMSFAEKLLWAAVGAGVGATVVSVTR